MGRNQFTKENIKERYREKVNFLNKGENKVKKKKITKWLTNTKTDR